MTTAQVSPQIWAIPISSVKEWVGPITAAAFGQPVDTFQVACVPYGTEPTDTDWEDPVPHPDGLIDGLGILVAEQTSHPLTLGKSYAIPVREQLGQSEPVIDDVGIVVGI